MLIGMTFTCLTVALFGVSETLERAKATRFIGGASTPLLLFGTPGACGVGTCCGLTRPICTGLFNGVIGVTKTYLGLITDETNEAQAFGFLALCWGAGGILGPAIGGLLAQPAAKYPAFFPAQSVWDEYPFLLPCLVTSMIPGCGVVLAAVFMKEPDRSKKKQTGRAQHIETRSESPTSTEATMRSCTSTVTVKTWEEDLSRTIGCGKAGSVPLDAQCYEMTDLSELMAEEMPSQVVGIMAVAHDGAVYRTIHHDMEAATIKGGTWQEGMEGSREDLPTTRASPTLVHGAHRAVTRLEAGIGFEAKGGGREMSHQVQHIRLLDDDACREEGGKGRSSQSEGEMVEGEGEGAEHEKSAMSYVLGRKAVVSTLAYAILRLIVIGLDDAMPLMMSTPRPSGMGLDSNSIGLALFGQGILLVSHVLFIFPYLKDRLGTLQLFWLSALTVPFVCWILPFVADLQPHVPPWLFFAAVEASMGLKCFSFATGFTAVTLLINNSAPARVIGTINGCSQTAAAAASMIAPSLAGSLFSWSLQNDMDFPFDFHFTFFLEGIFGFGLVLCALFAPPSLSKRYVE